MWTCLGRHFAVPEQFPDGGQTLAERQSPRRIAVATIMKPQVVEPSLRPDAMPVVRDVRHAASRSPSDNHPGIARLPPEAIEHRCHRCGHRYHARTCLRVPKTKLTGRTVHVVPTQRENLRMPASREHQQPDGRNRRRPHRALRLRFAQCTAQAPVLLGRQEPLARMLLVAAHGAARIPSRGNELPRRGALEHARSNPDAALAVQGLSRSP